MKKKLLVFALFVVLISTLTVVNAATPAEDLKAFASQSFTVAGETVKLSDADLVKLDRFLEDNEVTAEQVESIKAKVNETVEYINETGVESLADLTTAQKQTVLAKANEAAQVVGATISYDSADGVIEVYKDSELIESLSTSNALAQTGGQSAVYYVAISVLAIIAVASVIYIRKK